MNPIRILRCKYFGMHFADEYNVAQQIWHKRVAAKCYSSPTSTDSCKEWRPKKAKSFDYLKAYVLAMLGNYDPLYKLYCEQECGREVPGKWANADPKAVDEVLLRLYNFEKRLLVAALALLYLTFMSFMGVAIVYFSKQTIKDLNDLKLWESEFEAKGSAITFEQFLERYFLKGKVRKMSYFSPPNILIVTLEDGSKEVVDCKDFTSRRN